MLTKGLDNVAGTAGNDTIIGSITATVPAGELDTLATLDIINGGAGIDTLKIASSLAAGTALDLPNLSNIEIIQVEGTTGVTINTSAVAGVTNLNILKQGAGKVDATAAATTDIAVTVKEDDAGVAAALANVIKGGKNVTVTATDLGGATAGGTPDTIAVGGAGALAAAGDVVVNATGAKSVAATNKTLSAVTVTGGKTISVTQKATSDAAAAATDTTGATITQGAVTIIGNASTTAVTSKQDAAVTAVPAQVAVAAKAATQEVTFTEAKKGDTVTLTFGTTLDKLTFTAKKDLSAAEVASAFANLTKDAFQGKASATLGIYTDIGDGVKGGWTSGAVETVSATQSKVVFSTNTLTAGAPTTSITTAVTGTATATAAGAVNGVTEVKAVTGVLGVVAGKVDIQDTGVGFIKTITVDGYGASSVIGTTGATAALETLNLSNAGVADMVVGKAAATLALNLEKIGTSVTVAATNVTTNTAAVLTLTAAPTTLNVKSTGNNYVNLTAAATETLNVSGTGLLNLKTPAGGSTDLAALKTVKVTETAGLTLNGAENDTLTSVDTTGTTGAVTVSINGDKATYAGGAGVDTVTVTNPGTAISKAIDLGAGNDRLDLSAATPVTPTVTLEGGAGDDIVVLKSADAASLTTATAFEAKINSFEKLEVTQTLANARDSINLDNLDDISYVITNGQAAGAGGSKEVQSFTVTSGVTAKQVNATQTIDFTGVVVGSTGGGNITVGGLDAAVANDADAAAIATAVAGALNSQKPTVDLAATNQAVKAVAVGNVVTITYDTRDGAPAAQLAVAATATLAAGSAALPGTTTAGATYSANAQTITLGGVTIAALVAQHADKDGAAVAATGDDATAVAGKIVAALDLNAAYVAADTSNTAAAVTLKFAADGNQAPVALTAGTTGVTIGAVTETNSAVSTQLNLTKMLDNGTVEIKDAGVLTVVEMKDAEGAADKFNIVANGATGKDLGTVQVAKVETINITANDTDALKTAGVDNVSTNTLALSANKAGIINVTGAGNLILTLAGTSTEVTLIDGSTATGMLTVATLAGDTAATTVKGGSAADTLTAAGANDVLLGGAGKDTLKVTTGSAVTLTGGDGIDAFDVSGFKGTVGGAATITDFAKGETIKFVSNAAADFNSGKVTLISEATFTEYVNEAMKIASVNTTVDHGVSWFQFGGNTFVVQNMAADNTFTDGADIIVKLTGTVDLSTSSFNEVGQGTLMYI